MVGDFSELHKRPIFNGTFFIRTPGMRPNLLQRKARTQKSELVRKVYQAAGFLPSPDFMSPLPLVPKFRVKLGHKSAVLWPPGLSFATADIKFGPIRLSCKTGPYWVSSLKPPVIRYQSFFRRLQSVLQRSSSDKANSVAQ